MVINNSTQMAILSNMRSPDLKSAGAEKLLKLNQVTQGPVAEGSSVDFAGMIDQFMQNTSKLQNTSRESQFRLQMGDPVMSVERAVIDANTASLSFSAVLSTRNKLLEAYKEVMSIPV